MKRAQIKRFIISLIGVLMTSIYPLMFLWMVNFIQVTDITRILNIIGMLCAGSAALWLLLLVLYKNTYRATLAAIVGILFFENGAVLQSLIVKMLPFLGLRYWHAVPLLALLFVFIMWLIGKLKTDLTDIAAPVACAVFTALVAINVVTAVPGMLSLWQRKNARMDNAAELIVENGSDGRNVYWLLFDQLSSNDVYKKYYHYDNSAFTDWLEDKGFFVSYTSANETNRTLVVTANIGNLDYVVHYSNDRTVSEDMALINNARQQAILCQIFKAHGYQILGIGNPFLYGYTGDEVTGASTDGATEEGSDIGTLFWAKTIIAPFMGMDTNAYAESINKQLKYLQNPENIPEDHTFVLYHTICPHGPYVFMEDGSLRTAAVSSNIDPYVGQSIYVAGEIKKMVETIIENDPNALIAIVSDHGARADVEYDDSRHIFAALYNGTDEQIDIDGMSGLNIMIAMMNEALGTNMEYREVPVFEGVLH